MYFWKIINNFYKDYLKKLIIISLLINSILFIVKLSIKFIKLLIKFSKQKKVELAKNTNK